MAKEPFRAPDGSIGSFTLPGLTKVGEECGELIQVLAKISAIGKISRYWDGTRLDIKLIEEIGDLEATLDYIKYHNGLDREAIKARKKLKNKKFARWHKNVRAGRDPNDDGKKEKKHVAVNKSITSRRVP